jgi:hypothetical protein
MEKMPGARTGAAKKFITSVLIINVGQSLPNLRSAVLQTTAIWRETEAILDSSAKN